MMINFILLMMLIILMLIWYVCYFAWYWCCFMFAIDVSNNIDGLGLIIVIYGLLGGNKV